MARCAPPRHATAAARLLPPPGCVQGALRESISHRGHRGGGDGVVPWGWMWWPPGLLSGDGLHWGGVVSGRPARAPALGGAPGRERAAHLCRRLWLLVLGVVSRGGSSRSSVPKRWQPGLGTGALPASGGCLLFSARDGVGRRPTPTMRPRCLPQRPRRTLCAPTCLTLLPPTGGGLRRCLGPGRGALRGRRPRQGRRP